MKKILYLPIFIILGACVDYVSVDKEDAEKRVEAGDDQDYCATFNWYDDGQCDLFCTNPDPDCELKTCDTAPVCTNGTYPVSSCQPNIPCTEKESCGETIYCEAPISECEIDDVQLCPDGETFSSTCPPEMECASYHDNCGNYYACIGAPTQECPDDMLEVEKCRFDDPDCVVVISDDDQISCIPNIVCQVPAFCKTGERLFRNKDECLALGPKCRQTYRCGDIGWCSPEADCKKETCSDAEIVVNKCEAVAQCRDAASCGEDLLCMAILE